MNHDNITSPANIAREQLIQMLNKDLAIEYEAVIAFIVYSQVLKRWSYADIAWQLELHAAEDFQHATRIAKQIRFLGGIPCVGLNTVKTPNEPAAMLLSSIIRNHEYKIDLASLLGIAVAHTNRLAPENSPKPRQARVSPTSSKSGLPNQTSMRRNTAKPRASDDRASRMLQPA